MLACHYPRSWCLCTMVSDIRHIASPTQTALWLKGKVTPLDILGEMWLEGWPSTLGPGVFLSCVSTSPGF